MNGTTSKYTVWHYVGCGCVVLFVLAILGVGGCFFAVTRWGKQMEADIKDPEARAARARSILGFEELPEGYHPGFSFSLPFVMDVVMLGDHELPAGEEMEQMNSPEEIFGERGFLFMRMRGFGQDRTEVRNEMDVDFDPEEEVAQGELTAGGATVRYTTALGTTDLGARDVRSVTAELEMDCGDGFFREALWFVPVPGVPQDEAGHEAGPEAPEEAPAEVADEPSERDLSGTPADEAALKAFLDHFRFCG